MVHADRYLQIAFSQEFVIAIYTSTNLLEWEHASNFTYQGLLGLQYECPNLVTMPVLGSDEYVYLMYISVNPGAPLGGSAGQYFPGYFNGTHFTAVDSALRLDGFGKDYYAPQFFYGTPDGSNAISIAWASNWQYTNDVPTGPLEGWRSTFSVPRESYLVNATRVGWDMVSRPYNLDAVLGSTLASNDSLGNGTVLVDFSTVPSNAVYFRVNLTGVPESNVTGTLNFTYTSPVTGEYLRGGYYLNGDFFLDRGGVRFYENPFFTDKFSTASPFETAANGTFSLESIIDRSIWEVFLDGGVRHATNTFFPSQPLTQLTISTRDLNRDVVVSVEVRAVESAWADYADEDGLVVGNVTDANSTMLRRSQEQVYRAKFS